MNALIFEVGEPPHTKTGLVCRPEAMSWIGHIYRFLQQKRQTSSKEVHDTFSFEKLTQCWLGLHTLSYEMAAERLEAGLRPPKRPSPR